MHNASKLRAICGTTSYEVQLELLLCWTVQQVAAETDPHRRCTMIAINEWSIDNALIVHQHDAHQRVIKHSSEAKVTPQQFARPGHSLHFVVLGTNGSLAKGLAYAQQHFICMVVPGMLSHLQRLTKLYTHLQNCARTDSLVQS